MNRGKDIILGGLIIFCIFIAIYLFPYKNAPQSNNTDKLIQSIDSLKQSITDRDTLFIPRDSVVYRTNTIKQQIERYYTTHDTIERLIRCDSIISECDSLADQYNRQDSLYRKPVSYTHLTLPTKA